MPEERIRQIMTATDPADVAQMAMIECLRQIADNGKIANRQLEGMQVELRDVRERVIRIEATEFKGTIEKVDERISEIEDRVDALEADKNRRDGALSLVEWVGRNWPALIGFVALVSVLVMTGKVRL